VKSWVPELVFAGELVERAEAVAETEGSAAAEWVCAGDVAGVADDAGVPVSADVGDPPGVPAKAAADPLVAATDAAAGGFDPDAAHAVRPAPPMTAAIITARTRHILIPLLLR